jgi:hypothetical protein
LVRGIVQTDADGAPLPRARPARECGMWHGGTLTACAIFSLLVSLEKGLHSPSRRLPLGRCPVIISKNITPQLQMSEQK